MNVPLVIMLLVLLVALWALIRIRRSAKEDKAPSRPAVRSAKSQYHAVSIKISGYACKAAQEMSGRRFLSTAAPRLPLPDCDALECKCRFAHHDDRRTGKDRRSPFAPAGFGSGTGNYQTEHREGGDRRKRQDDDYF